MDKDQVESLRLPFGYEGKLNIRRDDIDYVCINMVHGNEALF